MPGAELAASRSDAVLERPPGHVDLQWAELVDGFHEVICESLSGTPSEFASSPAFHATAVSVTLKFAPALANTGLEGDGLVAVVTPLTRSPKGRTTNALLEPAIAVPAGGLGSAQPA